MSEEKYSTDITKTKYVNDSKITDHYALTPTGQGYENYEKLPELQKRVYKIIVKRFLAIFFPPAEFNKISVTIKVENEQFTTSGKVCTKIGYLEILKSKDAKEEAESENKENLDILNTLKKGQKINVLNYMCARRAGVLQTLSKKENVKGRIL